MTRSCFLALVGILCYSLALLCLACRNWKLARDPMNMEIAAIFLLFGGSFSLIGSIAIYSMTLPDK